MTHHLRARRTVSALGAAACLLFASVAVQVTTAGAAAAVPGLIRVYAVSPPQSIGAQDQNAICPAGRQVIGGGASVSDNQNNKVFLTESYPSGDRTWHVRAAAELPGWDGVWNLTAYAICAAPMDGYELHWGNSGPGAATFKTTFTTGCPKGTKVLSAGGRVNADHGGAGLTMIRPDGPLSIGRASARVARAGYANSWSVDSFAICAVPPPGLQNLGFIAQGHAALQSCPHTTTLAGIGGGGGLVDLGPYYLRALAPNADLNGAYVEMSGFQQGGTLVQTSCAD
jgi:hypothetical protein